MIQNTEPSSIIRTSIIIDKMQDKQKEIRFFDTFEDEGYDALNERGYNRILAEFKKLVNPITEEVMVDFGCGTGAFTSRVRKFGLNCTGIDISPKCIEYARKKYPNKIGR